MSIERDEYPSLTIDDREPPFGWIQWKGTEVCMDVHCQCGAHLHVDADFCYHIKCGECGQVYECSGFIRLIPLDFEPSNTLTAYEHDDGATTVRSSAPAPTVQPEPTQRPSGVWVP